MIISMQGNWTVTVKAKNAAFAQRFIVSGASSGNGVHAGTPGTSVAVTGRQWSIAIQNNPGNGFQTSATQIKFPQHVNNHYQFDIHSNDAGADQDFDDLILTCSTPATINDFIVYGHVSLYSGPCIFNPCRRGPFVIDTPAALQEALKNPVLRDELVRLYPERIALPPPHNPPDPPPYFQPVVLDVLGDMVKPRTAMVYQRIDSPKERKTGDLSFSNFQLLRSITRGTSVTERVPQIELAKLADSLIFGCVREAGTNLTLSFDEYDRSAAELAGGAYTGTGPRRALGDSITDMNGNYLFRFTFDMSLPFLEDADDVAGGEDVNVVLYPDVIAKIIGFAPPGVRYESAPYHNIPNLKRIDLCLPKSTVQPTFACFNGNLIGSLGNVFLGGNQNTHALELPVNLQRDGNGNLLEANGKISVHSPLAGFSVDCAGWHDTIDIKGCLYNSAKPASQNPVTQYTLRIKRADSSGDWTFISENYKHPKFSKRNLPGYIGDDVGPSTVNLHVDGAATATPTPTYLNIQHQIHAAGVDWEFTNSDRYMRLHTALYDVLEGIRTPGTFHLRVDGYDNAGNPVNGATDMIALFIHNLPMKFALTTPGFPSDPSIVHLDCGLYRLSPSQLPTPLQLQFMANDPHGFIDHYALTMGRCPGDTLALQFNQPPGISNTVAGATTLLAGNAASNTHANLCPGYRGTLQDFSEPELVTVNIQPALSGPWIRPGEHFTVLSFGLSAALRLTNGYNTGLTSPTPLGVSLYLEPLAP